MALPVDFRFSQSSLQDYVDCARRFELRYLEQLVWPAAEAEPLADFERQMELGARFHKLAHQYIEGIAAESLDPLVGDEPLKTWWANFLQSGLDGLPAQRYPEITLATQLGAYRLIAKFDLLALEPGGRAVVVDWKTGRRQGREWLEQRLQTVVYRYVLAAAGASLDGGQVIAPERVEMRYWFADAPDRPERFGYDAEQFEADEAYLSGLITEIAALPTFPLTEDERRCRFCTYRSLCRRGVAAGDLAEMDAEAEADGELDFDFDQIAEIEF